jgi:hypothetical protein
MAEANIDAALDNLRRVFGDTGLLLTLVVDLRRDTDRLLEPLTGELRRTRDAIDAALDVLSSR